MWIAGRGIAPGAGYGSLAAAAAPLHVDAFIPLLLLVGALLAVLWVAVSRAIAARRSVGAAAVRRAMVPALWGASVPAAALLLDAVSFWPTASPLAALGCGAGGLLAARRLTALPAGSHGDTRAAVGARWLLVLASMLLPMALLAGGWSAPSGDEPNYLTAAHSLVVDGDLDLANDYRERVYAPFHPTVLSPHYRPGLREGSRYSMHGLGLPLLISPAYALGRALQPSFPGALVAMPRALLILLYGVFAWTLFGFVEETVSARAAVRATAAGTLLAPLLFAPLFIFSETPAMLLSLLAFRGVSGKRGRGAAAGLALAALPFLGVKYIPLAAAVWAAGLWVAPAQQRRRRALLAGLPLAAALALHTLFTWRLYGSLSPAAIYLGAGNQAGAPALGGEWGAYVAAWPAAVATAVGYLLDQKEGLLAYGPHFMLAVAGCAWLWRRQRRLLVATALVAAAYVGPYALSQQLGGQGPPVRPLMAVLWVIAPALGVALTLPANCRGYALLRGATLGLSGVLTAAYAAQPELLPHDYPVLASRLLQNYSPYGWQLWRLFPQWVNVDEPNRLITAAWTLVLVVLAAALWRHGAGIAAASGVGTTDDDGGAGRDRGADDRSRAAGAAAAVGWHAALAVVGVACALVLLHHAAVTRTDRHRPTPMDDGLTAWVPQELPAVVFAESGGVWATPGRSRNFLLASPVPLQSMDVGLRVLLPAQVAVAVQGAAAGGTAAPGANLVARLRLGPGRAQGSQWLYHASLFADRGAAPADLLGGEDERHLGVMLQINGLRRR